MLFVFFLSFVLFFIKKRKWKITKQLFFRFRFPFLALISLSQIFRNQSQFHLFLVLKSTSQLKKPNQTWFKKLFQHSFTKEFSFLFYTQNKIIANTLPTDRLYKVFSYKTWWITCLNSVPYSPQAKIHPFIFLQQICFHSQKKLNKNPIRFSSILTMSVQTY